MIDLNDIEIRPNITGINKKEGKTNARNGTELSLKGTD